MAGRAVGTVVVKVEFDRLEATWARTAGPGFVTDAHGVILITSVPEWRFRATHPLDAATLAQARSTLQFGSGPPQAAPLTLSGASATATLGGTRAQYRVGSLPVPLAESRLIHLEPLAGPLAAATTRVRLWGLGILIVLGAIAGLAWRAREKRQLQREARVALEQEVARRTAELRETNSRLTIESRERVDAERRFRAAREELAQANRLGSLGQITAGVAHEINQPVAAIRTFAENAGTFLDRDQIDPVRGNLAQIIDLTARIGSITAELRNFARRRTPARGAIALGSVIDGALLILGERAREVVTVDLPAGMRDTQVAGDRVRLEQILVNLLQNALDAVEGVAAPRILIAAAASGSDVTVTVGDNGPGVDPTIADQLFAPFVSAKPEGLGLGLAIARDIAREFGGELEIGSSALDGAAFTLEAEARLMLFPTDQSIFFVEDDAQLRQATLQTLELAGLSVRPFASATEALPEIRPDFTGAIVSDIRMPGIDGLLLLERVRAIDPDIPVILITGHADVAMAVGALRDGAFDFPDQALCDRPSGRCRQQGAGEEAAGDRQSPAARGRGRRRRGRAADRRQRGDGPATQYDPPARARRYRRPGGGRDRHRQGACRAVAAPASARRGRPFIAVNCGALPEALAEVELFGHAADSVPHTRLARVGQIEASSGGTLLLDEIDSMAPAVRGAVAGGARGTRGPPDRRYAPARRRPSRDRDDQDRSGARRGRWGLSPRSLLPAEPGPAARAAPARAGRGYRAAVRQLCRGGQAAGRHRRFPADRQHSSPPAHA